MEQRKGKCYSVYVGRWFSGPKIFDHIWACKTKAVGRVMLTRKEIPQQVFSGKLKKGGKIC
jgi:hypothetical protein